MDKINIFLDDERIEPEGFIVARDAHACLELLRQHQGRVAVLSLDHDLGDPSCGTGMCVVREMLEEGLYADEIYTHSRNPYGRQAMFESLVQGRERGLIPAHVKVFNGYRARMGGTVK